MKKRRPPPASGGGHHKDSARHRPQNEASSPTPILDSLPPALRARLIGIVERPERRRGRR